MNHITSPRQIGDVEYHLAEKKNLSHLLLKTGGGGIQRSLLFFILPIFSARGWRDKVERVGTRGGVNSMVIGEKIMIIRLVNCNLASGDRMSGLARVDVKAYLIE